jgi:hypothetical protein
LSDHFEQVTILERVPQAWHTHGLLAGSRQELERVFPGVTREMVEAGAVPGDVVRDYRWFFEGGCLAQVESGLDAVAASRPSIESFIRRRTLALPNGGYGKRLRWTVFSRRTVAEQEYASRRSHSPQTWSWTRRVADQRPRTG